MATAEQGIFLEQSLLDIEAERLGLVVGIAFVDVGDREFIDDTVPVEHVVQRLAAILRLLRNQFVIQYFLDLEALGEFHELPEIGARLARRGDELVPELRAPLGIAIGAFLLHPHRGRQHEIGSERRLLQSRMLRDGLLNAYWVQVNNNLQHRRIGVADDNEIVGVAETRIGLLVDVGRPHAHAAAARWC
jgi:hypothetical protein